ncbi:Asp23/Gls24 family envelope stress response protein [Cryobacterium sp. PH31-L1]|uniref:Asp23/Gls24 family envelope stress response protein n=1 Tax=Cryobacterium sp. PH31-L1 TaxID=3046199 RepID=UPI0024B91580|nr:Asp23/Gls24 family envelope stress response protein [Cryobacterium sp. PH31-L1]MDJ0379052.1 Asp23/Gls24 family envelope stress response protein [Cryobacterium sp. PH31-L1]
MAVNDSEPRTLDCGKTVEELSDYLAAGRTPFDPRIETCPECLNALQGLTRVSQLFHSLIQQDVADLPAPRENWFQDIMTNIHREVRAGRSLPLPHPDNRVNLSLTEGAVLALIRTVGDTVPGMLIGTSHLEGNVEELGAPIDVSVAASILWNQPIPDAAHTLRALISNALTKHTALNITSINITIEDLHEDMANKDMEN